MNENDIAKLQGLSEAEAREKLRQGGYNELPSEKARSVWKLIGEVLLEPMFMLLTACGAIYLLLGDVHEAMVLIGFVFIIVGITIYQENKTEKALEALRNLSSPRALVIRDGEKKRIPGREVVAGDLILVSEGDRIPADGQVIWQSGLTIDESLLTGESVPVSKSVQDAEMPLGEPGGEDSPFAYSGTLTASGQGLIRVIVTGLDTQIGHIGAMLNVIEADKTPLQKETAQIVKKISVIGLLFCGLVVLVYWHTKGALLAGFLAGLTLAMAILPEEFPVILTVFLALGAWRISKKHILTRKMSAVETLGSATVLCVDKTGTLTMNKMAIEKLWADNRTLEIKDALFPISASSAHYDVLKYAVLACKKNPFDPMERAIIDFWQKDFSGQIENDLELAQEFPLSDGLLALANAWRKGNDHNYAIAAKGAPEAIFDLCHLDAAQKNKITGAVREIAEDGLRVLGIAKCEHTGRRLPGKMHDFEFEFVGLLGLGDPIRPEVPAAVARCYEAGIKVMMITGDYAGTARSIARQVGLAHPDDAISGHQLADMSDRELHKRIQSVNIFSRMIPEHKLRIIKALRKNGDIVAMTGDGVNDAPALKSAHIGVAMGERGTDVAREASSIVLLDDNFASLVEGVKEGRRIFYNLRKAVAYTLSIHIPIAGLSLIPIIMGWPLVLFPVHIVFLELIIDPACSLLFEAEPADRNIMKRPPRDPRSALFDRKLLWLSSLQGLSVLAATLLMYKFSIGQGHSASETRALIFATLIFANIILIAVNRSWSQHFFHTVMNKNIILWWIIGLALVFLYVIIYIPAVSRIFSFSPLHLNDVFMALLAAVSSLLWFEIYKVMRKFKS